MSRNSHRFAPAVAAGTVLGVTLAAAAFAGSLHVSRQPQHTEAHAAASPGPEASPGSHRSIKARPKFMAPADAVWHAGDNAWARAVNGLSHAMSSASAVAYFHSHAFNGQEAGYQSEPVTHLWSFSAPAMGINDRAAWFVQFSNVSTANMEGPESGPGVYTGCTETYIVDANSGAGLDDVVTCPPASP